MTLASSVASLSESAIRNLGNIRYILNRAETVDARLADLARKVHDDLTEMHSLALDALDDEDGAPLTQEEVTRS